MLWQPDPAAPVGRADNIAVYGDRIAARISFAAPGISTTADEVCGLVKSGVVSAVSVGFDIIEAEPLDPRQGALGGLRISKWELLECSFVSVPADTGAVVTARSHGRRSAMVAEHKALMETLGESIGAARNHLYAGRMRGTTSGGWKTPIAALPGRSTRRARPIASSASSPNNPDFDATHTIQTSAGTGIDHGSDTDRGYRRRQAEKLRLAAVLFDMLPLPLHAMSRGAPGWGTHVREFEEQRVLAHLRRSSRIRGASQPGSSAGPRSSGSGVDGGGIRSGRASSAAPGLAAPKLIGRGPTRR